MFVSFDCACGRKLRLKEEFAGRRIRCPACDKPVLVPVAPEEDLEEVGEEQRIMDRSRRPTAIPVRPPSRRRRDDDDDEERRNRERRRRDDDDDDDDEELDRAGSRRRRDDDDDDEEERDQERERRRRDTPPPRKRPKRKRRSSSDAGSGFGIAVHPSIIAGILMMIGAVIWFVAGLAAGWIYFYPPVLFVCGIAAVIRGFTGGD